MKVVTSSLTINKTYLKMALITAHLNEGIILVVTFDIAVIVSLRWVASDVFIS